MVSAEDFRAMTLRIAEAHLADRARLSRFLHDEVAQFLSGAGMQLDLVRMDFEDSVPAIGPRVEQIQKILEEIVVRIRDLSYELNPVAVERAGLHAALDHLVGRGRKQFKGSLRLLYDSSVRVPLEVAVAFHRIAEQAVENAIRHSGATLIEVMVKRSRRGHVLEVRDNGCGFDYPDVRSRAAGLGLVLIESCAARGGLRLHLGPNGTSGSVVRTWWAEC